RLLASKKAIADIQPSAIEVSNRPMRILRECPLWYEIGILESSAQDDRRTRQRPSPTGFNSTINQTG
ncbi:hypothetical protein RFM99_35655, partial [Mesorhizobium sp. VK4C]|uniref:hypothetical protein n=1 Tax=Mesorhizobium captivum TaxID=3072319 RepID=UPI002A24D9B0